MNVSGETIKGLGAFLKEHLEADVVAALSAREGLPAEDALRLYFASDVSRLVEEGAYGAQYLSADYLADEVLHERDGRGVDG